MQLFATLFAAIALTQGPSTPIKFKPGDVITVSTPAQGYGGDFEVLSDGAIYGRGFGRLTVSGKTFDETLKLVKDGLRKFVKPELVFLTIKHVRQDVVYLVGMSGGKGPMPFQPGLSLRQLLSTAEIGDSPDLCEVQLFRNGAQIHAQNVAELLSKSGDLELQLQPNDIVTLTPTAFVRVWLTGLVGKPGQIRIPAGSDVYRAIGEGGGLTLGSSLDSEAKILVRRGTAVTELPARQDLRGSDFKLESGDTISVVVVEPARITVTGYVKAPGEVIARGDTSLLASISLAGGASGEGTLENVLIFRGGEMYQHNAASPSANSIRVQTGDVIHVRRNDRAFHVLGEVRNPGRVTMEDGKEYRMADALAQAGGLGGKGTLRRVFLARPNADGKVTVRQFNLDEYLKDGKLESNPVVQAGDALLFGQPNGLSLAGATQLLSSALMFEALMGR